MNQSEKTEKTQKTYGPYSVAREAGPLVFISGQIGVNPDTGTTEPDSALQTHQVIRNLETALQSVGLTLSDVVDTTVFLTDMSDFSAVNSAYAEHFSQPYPARACVAVAELPRLGGDVALKVEIKATAMRRA